MTESVGLPDYVLAKAIGAHKTTLHQRAKNKKRRQERGSLVLQLVLCPDGVGSCRWLFNGAPLCQASRDDGATSIVPAGLWSTLAPL